MVFSNLGPEYQELQVTAMADFTQLQFSTAAAANWHAPAKQPDGAVVTHAFPDATRLPITQGI